MSVMNDVHNTISEYLYQGDNVYRISSVLNVPLSWVLEVQQQMDYDNAPEDEYRPEFEM